MKIAACFAVFLAYSKEAFSAPLTSYPSSSTFLVQTSLPTNSPVSASVSSNNIATSAAGSTDRILNVLQGLFSAISTYGETSTTGSSSSVSSTSSTSVSSSEINWKSLLGQFFGGYGINSSPSSSVSPGLPVATTPISSKLSTVQTTSASVLSPTVVTVSPSSSLITTSKPVIIASTTSKSQASSTSTSTSSIYDSIYNSTEEIDQDFSIAILDAHNRYRAAHGVGALSWSSAPYAYAKQYADSYDCSGVLTHSGGQYGENLAAGFADGPSAVDAWYDEGKTFDYSTLNEYNHFTQVVWKDSTMLGCAYKDCTAEGWQLYVICEYNPPGNYIGEEKANVLPLVS